MPDTASLIIFGIQAAIRLGGKVIEVYQDEMRDRNIILPLAESTGSFTYGAALDFFKDEGKLFVEEGGLYHELWKKIGPDGNATRKVKDKLRKAAVYVDRVLNKAKAQEMGYVDEKTFYKGMAGYYAIAQWKKGDPGHPNLPLQRIAGTVLEIGLDYVKTDSSFLVGDSKSEKIVRSILLALEPIEFAEQKADAILVDLFKASMAVFYNNADMIIEDKKLELLLKEISGTLKDEVDAVDSARQLIMLQEFGRDVLQGILKASASVVVDNTSLFLGEPDSDEKHFVTNVLKAVLETIKTKPDIFSGKILVDIYSSALKAVGENAKLLLSNGNREEFLAYLFTSLATGLADNNPSNLFTLDVLKEVIVIALEATSNNVHLLINPKKPEEQLLSDALKQVLLAFSDDFTENETFSDIASGLFSRNNLVQIIAVVFDEVSKNPEALLHKVSDDNKKSALAQVIGSVTAAIAAEPLRLLNGEDFTELIDIVFQAFVKNPDRLIDLSKASPTTNVMYQVIVQILESVRENRERGGRDLLTGQWLLTSLDTALSVVSKNTDAFNDEAHKAIVKQTLDKLLYVASNSHANVLDAENLVAIFGPVLTSTLGESSILGDDNTFNDLINITLDNLA